MNKKSDPPQAALIKPTDDSPPISSGQELDEVNYPVPSDGIAMHIEELKENLASIREETGIDPNLLPEIDQE